MRKLGTLEPVIYFVNGADPTHPVGYILIASYTDCPTPEGYRRESADTLPDIDRLQAKLQSQEHEQWERDAQADESLLSQRRKEVQDRLYARMTSGSTSQYDKDFISAYLKLREEKRAKHAQRFFERVCYLHAREFDTPADRGVDEESVNLDRITVK